MANALQYEKSPYLLQHQHNPVNWMPWGEAAFRQAAHTLQAMACGGIRKAVGQKTRRYC